MPSWHGIDVVIKKLIFTLFIYLYFILLVKEYIPGNSKCLSPAQMNGCIFAEKEVAGTFL